MTPSITITPSITPSITITPSLTPTPTRTPTQTPYTYLGRSAGPDAASIGIACSTYASGRGYYSIRSSPASIIVGDVIYDSYPNTPTEGNSNWIALKLNGTGNAYSFQIGSGGQVLSVGGICS